MVNGKTVVKDGQILGIDEGEVRTKANACVRTLLAKGGIEC